MTYSLTWRSFKDGEKNTAVHHHRIKCVYKWTKNMFYPFGIFASLLKCVLHVFFPLSSHSDVASGMSDGNEGVTGGRHEGRSAKRHQRRSVRSRSRHDKITKAKLNVLNVRQRLCSLSYIEYC